MLQARQFASAETAVYLWKRPPDLRSVPCGATAHGGGRCPACGRAGSIAPASSEYHGRGRIHHHWLCGACGHDWVTVLQVAT